MKQRIWITFLSLILAGFTLSGNAHATFASPQASARFMAQTRPFYGMPFYPGQGMPARTGQMQMNPYMSMAPLYISNNFNWRGAQPMGASYMPPIGLSSMMNSYNYGQFRDRYYGTSAY